MQWIISFWYQLSELEHGSHNNIPCMDIVPYVVERCYNAAQHNDIVHIITGTEAEYQSEAELT